MQTAVEWLINELIELDKLLDGRRKNEDDTVFKLPPDKLYEQAKQMEKEQIIDAMEKTAMYVSAALIDKEIGKMTFEDLYNQTYNQNK
jgi:hypothetical protein